MNHLFTTGENIYLHIALIISDFNNMLFFDIKYPENDSCGSLVRCC